jgi:hypothetical protein
MNNLLSIEQALLANEAVATGLNLTAIKSALKAEGNAQKAKFTKTLALSKLVAQAHAWFHSDEAKAIFAESGVTWTNEDFAAKVFGWKKSYFQRVVKVGNLDQDKVDEFISLCDQAERQGHTADRTIVGLLKWAKASSQAAEAAANEDGQESDGEDGQESDAPSVVRAEVLLTLAFKATIVGAERNVALRVNTDGTAVTSNTKAEIEQAMALLQAALSSL